MQVPASGTGHNNRVSMENVGLHALATGTEPHMGSALEERFANRGELRGISLFDGFTLRHGR
jgi:hypothetical protein